MIGASWDHLRKELELLNSCLLREVNQRTQKNKQLDLLQGLVLSEQDVIEILTSPMNLSSDESSLADKLTKRDETYRGDTTLAQTSRPLFRLSGKEELCLLLCLAPEIDNRYARVFAFLQDDVTRRQPSVELALRLFCSDTQELLDNRSVLSSGGSLSKTNCCCGPNLPTSNYPCLNEP